MEAMQQVQLSNQAVSNLARRCGFKELLQSDAPAPKDGAAVGGGEGASTNDGTSRDIDANDMFGDHLPVCSPLLLQDILVSRVDPPSVRDIVKWITAESNPLRAELGMPMQQASFKSFLKKYVTPLPRLAQMLNCEIIKL